jgi:hypothetical protein
MIPTGIIMESNATGEMPCCPDEAPRSDCAKGCPLMALCAATGILFFAPMPGLNVTMTPARAFIPGSVAELRGLAQRPPPRPPKA